MDPHQEWLKSLEDASLDKLYAELDNEKNALDDILSDEPYEDKARQIEVTKENIQVIKNIIGKKESGNY